MPLPRAARGIAPVAAGLALVGASLTGCEASGPGDDSGTVRIVAGFYAMQWMAERVGGDDVAVSSLTQPGREPHDAELTVARTAEVIEADVVLRAAGFQPAVDEAAAEAASGADLEALEVLGARDPAISGARPVTVLEGDPHFWLDPRALATVAEELTDRLVELDPEHAEDYRSRFAELQGELVGLDGRFAVGLEDCERRTVVTGHDAFGYLGYRYDLDLESVAGLSPDAEPSPAHLGELADLVLEQGITTVFGERIAGPELAEALSEELGLDTAVLDPVEGLTDETADDDYLSLMSANLKALTEANRCR